MSISHFMVRASAALSAAIWALLLGTTVARADTVFIDPTSGHGYELVVKSEAWNAASLDAQALTFEGVGGHLATITSAEENLFISNAFKNYIFANSDNVWIGGYQPAGSVEPAGGWSWVTGEAFTYSNWQTLEPNNSFGTEDRIVLRTAAGQYTPDGAAWNDYTGTFARSAFVAEFDTVAAPLPVPAAGAAVLLSLVYGFRIRRRSVGASCHAAS